MLKGVRVLLSGWLVLAAVGCTSSSTSTVVAPSVIKCTVGATSNQASFTAAGGVGQVTVAAERDCTWSAETPAAWVSISGPTSGQGEATLPYRVAPNTTPSARNATITVSSAQVDVAQEGAPCRFTLDRSSANVPATGGPVTFKVDAMSGCSWTASSESVWVGITGGRTGNGPGTVTLSIDQNAAAARSTRVLIADQVFAVAQDANILPAPSAPTPPPSPTPPAPPPPTPPPTPPPPPAPTPPSPPPPPPPPEPPHPTGEKVEMEGIVFGVLGACPNVGFWIGRQLVVASASTDYAKGDSCGSVRNFSSVKVRGEKWTDGTVRANTINVNKDRGGGNNDDVTP